MENQSKLIDDFSALVQQMTFIAEGLKELQKNPNATITQVPTEGNPPPAKEDEEAVTDRFKKMVAVFNKNY